MKQHFTIGVAGHIDHGKTALTKALTGINTDRLKEEQERSISIEPGFASLINDEALNVSLIDVPGHENFIRQMIAGVAGIDFVLLIIAADEGIMPQTREHLAILSLLGINQGFVVMTKIDQADPELLEIVLDDVKETLHGTFLEKAPLFKVDSISKKGITQLKSTLKTKLSKMGKTETNNSFRLPVDHVFTVKGQGVIARGTVYNGLVKQGNHLKLLPSGIEVRVRQIQTHGNQVEAAVEGQRTALNLGGVSLDQITRGDVLVEDDFYTVSDRIDIVFESLLSLSQPIKQRQLIKLHIGTTEVMGKIIFFDRNEVSKSNPTEILCQLQLDEKIVVARDDRFIVRRPSPSETIGGGLVIDPHGEKYRFGKKTINQLQLKQEGTIKERIIALLNKKMVLSKSTILNQMAINEQAFSEVQSNVLALGKSNYTLNSLLERTKNRIVDHIKDFHETWPMQVGIDKAELVSILKKRDPALLIEYALESLRQDGQIKVVDQYISLKGISPSLPPKWEKMLEYVEKDLIKQGAEVDKWSELIGSKPIPEEIKKDFYYFLILTKRAFIFDDERLISKIAVNEMKQKLIDDTQQQDFTLQIAREALQLSRKNLVPFLELMDHLGYTKREGNTRQWMS